MLTKEIIELKNTEDQIRYNKEDYNDMRDLLISAFALMTYTNRRKQQFYFSAYLFHGIAITDGISAIKNLNNNARGTALLYCIFFVIFGKWAFSQQKIANEYKQQRDKHKIRYDNLKEILINSNEATIHQITQQYRKEIPNTDETEPDIIQAAIDHIIMKYQR